MQVTAQGRKDRVQARSSLEHSWPVLARGIQLSFSGAPGKGHREKWSGKIKCNSARS